MNKNPAYSIGAVHSSDRFGEFTIIGNPNSERMRIKFTNTGYERVANRDSIKRGEVHDHLAPTVFGIGCLGDGLPKPKTSLNRWRNILARFARGTSHGRLDPRWLNLRTFCDWHKQACEDVGIDIDTPHKIRRVKSQPLMFGPDTVEIVVIEKSD